MLITCSKWQYFGYIRFELKNFVKISFTGFSLSFFNVATGKFKIAYVAHDIFLQIVLLQVLSQSWEPIQKVHSVYFFADSKGRFYIWNGHLEQLFWIIELDLGCLQCCLLSWHFFWSGNFTKFHLNGICGLSTIFKMSLLTFLGGARRKSKWRNCSA